MSELHRAYPQDAEAERGVLSSLLLAPRDVRALCASLEVDSGTFYLPQHQALFTACAEIVDEGRALDFITLATRLTDAKKLEYAGGAPYLQELWGLLPSAANVSFYLDTLRQKAIRRQTIEIANALANAAYDSSEEPGEFIGDAHAALGRLLCRKSKRPTVKESLQKIVDEVREGRDDTGLLAVPLNGLGALRLYRGDVLIVSAPTSCGKTALAAQIALAVAKTGGRVAFYPLEMLQEQTLKRAIAQLGGNNVEYVRKLVQMGDTPTTRQAVGTFMETVKALLNFDIHLRDDLSKWDQIRADLRQEHANRPFGFVVIDYLQLIQSSGRHERRQLAIAEITQGAKLLAKELNCVICIPSQVNKAGGTREAEDAENDASALIKIHGEEDANGDTHPGRVSVWKQREGQRHVDLPLRFNGLMTRFEYSEEN